MASHRSSARHMSGQTKHSLFQRTAMAVAGVACLAGLATGVQVLQAVPEQSTGVMEQVAVGEWSASGTAGSNLPATASGASGAVLEDNSGEQLQVTEPVAYGATYGSVEIPKFGQSWTRPLKEGAGNDVIDTTDDKGRTVVSRYASTDTFGGSQNVGITGHSGGLYDLDAVEWATRNYDEESLSYSPFTRMDELAAGDSLIVATSAGRYTYKFLWSEVVNPEQNAVIYEQVYRSAERKPGDEVSTQALVVTTCGVLDDWSGDGSIRRIYYFELADFEPSA